MAEELIIKVCGMRQPDNIRQVEDAGATWMGFIFAERSPRYVSQVPAYLPQKAARAGVFVNADQQFIMRVLNDYHLDIVQLHGNESPEFVRQIKQSTGKIVVKAVHIYDATCYDAADYLLFDTGNGGTGQQFDWQRLSNYQGDKPFLLAGGIGPEDAERVLSIKHPKFAGVDLNSRFETSPAVKDAEAISKFIQIIRNKKTTEN